MNNLTPFGWLAAAWLIVTVPLALLLIYRAVVGLHEEDQIFLDPAEAGFETEQRAVLAKLGQLTGYVRGLAAASGAIMVAMIALIVFQTIGRLA